MRQTEHWQASGGMLIVLVLLSVSGPAWAAGLTPPQWTTGPEFAAAAERWISLTIVAENNSLRRVCDDVARTQQVAILVDRRLDPTQPVRLEPPVTGTTRQIVDRIAASQQAEVREFGDCLYLLPEERAAKFRTILALRRQEYTDLAEQGGRKTSREMTAIRTMLQPRPLEWNDLDRPRELALQICQHGGLRLRNPERIPHDLWHRGTIPRADLIEQLSFLLHAFDLTFTWQSLTEVEVIPIPDRVVLTRTHRISADQLAERKPRLSQEFPEATWKPVGTAWEVTGPEELHAQLARPAARGSETPSIPRVAWRDRKFTMRVQRKPLNEVLTYLQEAGVPVVFDDQAIQQQGVDPAALISFEVTNATAEQLFEALAQPVGLKYKLTDSEARIAENP